MWLPPGCTPPKYATARNFDRPTLGPRVALVSGLLPSSADPGAPRAVLMPWQSLVADVASELDPEEPGAWFYKRVIITVPRQAGKTTLLRGVQVDRALARPGAKIYATAQTGKDARKRWRDLADVVLADTSPLAGRARDYKSAGAEELRFYNGSLVAPFPPTPKGMHGETPPLVLTDEAWAFDGPGGDVLEQAIPPAQITLPDRQWWIVSTRGTSRSAWLNRLIRTGRAATADPRSRVAYFEWSADEALAEADPIAPETLAFHPALGHTQRLADLQAEYDPEHPGAFRRGFLNLDTDTDEDAVNLARWPGRVRDLERPRWRDVVLAYAVHPDRSAASVWAAWTGPEGTHLRFVATDAGSAWLAGKVRALARNRPAAVVAMGTGHTRAVTAELTKPGPDHVKVRVLTAGEWSTACEALIAAAEDGTTTHDGTQELTEALRGAEVAPRPTGRVWAESLCTGPVDALLAATAAHHVAATTGARVPQMF